MSCMYSHCQWIYITVTVHVLIVTADELYASIKGNKSESNRCKYECVAKEGSWGMACDLEGFRFIYWWSERSQTQYLCVNDIRCLCHFGIWKSQAASFSMQYCFQNLYQIRTFYSWSCGYAIINAKLQRVSANHKIHKCSQPQME